MVSKKYIADKKKIIKHFEKNYNIDNMGAGASRWLYLISARDMWDEFLNTLIGFLAMGEKEVNFWVEEPYSRNNESVNVKVLIKPETIRLIRKLNLIPDDMAGNILRRLERADMQYRSL
jgi:hypothetical protein